MKRLRYIFFASAWLLNCLCWGQSWTAADTIELFEALGKDQPEVPFPPAGPMLLWTGVGYEPQTPETIKLLNSQGFNQHLPLTGDHRKAAKALYQNKSPIQLMQGLKQFPIAPASNLRLPANAADSFNLATWRTIGDWVRQQLRLYRDSGMTINSLWLDYEGFPFLASQADVASRSVELSLPIDMSSEDWATWRRQFTLNALSSYVAAPAREIFPRISVLNWTVNLSYPESPLINAIGQQTPVSGPLLFTQSNPYAYGNTLSYELAGLPIDLAQAQVDKFYLGLLLRHASIDAKNRKLTNSQIGAVVWVARVVRDSDQSDIPVMSRSAYREALRHLWLRGIGGMMVFNPLRLTKDEHVAEIADAASVWREMSQHLSMLKRGEPANVGHQNASGYIWSSITTARQSLLRITPIDESLEGKMLFLPVWSDLSVKISCPQAPRSYLVWRNAAFHQSYILTEP